MKNSPTVCQLYVSQSFHNVPNDVHCMDYPAAQYLKRVSLPLLEDLILLNLCVAPEKLQSFPPYAFLRFAIAWKLHPLSFSLTFEDQYTLADLQQLCDSINWLKLFFLILEWEINSLFPLLDLPLGKDKAHMRS